MAAAHFSKFVDGRIGSFHHGLALVEATLSDEAAELLHAPTTLKRYAGEPEKLFRLLLELNSIAHERIHYLDTFGTLAGIALVKSRTTLLTEFLEVGGQMAARGIRWQLPLSDWVKKADVPPEIKRLADLAFVHRQAEKTFVAAVEPFIVEGHTEEAWVDLPFRPHGRFIAGETSIPAFPQSIGFLDPSGGSTERRLTVYHPLGYEAILEGRAHSMARSWIESVFPDAPSDLLANYGPPRAFRREDSAKPLPEDAASRFEIYNMTDFMVSKFLRRRGVNQFPRNVVLALSDRALSQSLFDIRRLDDRQIEVRAISPGDAFVSLMEALPLTGVPAVDYPEHISEMYRNTLNELERGGDLDTVTGIQPYKALRIWETFMAKHMTAPLLRRRLETNHLAYSDASSLMELAMEEHPRVEVINGRLSLRGMPTQVQSAWAAQMFLGEIAEQVFSGATTIRCPRAHRLLPGMETADFAHGECRASLRRGCGSCTAGVVSHEVPCMFSQALHAYGFVATPMPDPQPTAPNA